MRRQAVGAANERLRSMLLENAKLYDELARQAERNARAVSKKGDKSEPGTD